MRDALRIAALLFHAMACGIALIIVLDPFAHLALAFAFGALALFHGVYALRNVVRFALDR